MPKYFLDTSALAKLYHSEVCSDYMDRILKETGSQFVISRLSIVEMESVLATKVRTREIDQAGVDIGRRGLRQTRKLTVADFPSGYRTQYGNRGRGVVDDLVRFKLQKASARAYRQS